MPDQGAALSTLGSAPTRPRSPDVHLLRTEHGAHAFIVDGSRLFDLNESAFARLETALDGPGLDAVLAELGLRTDPPRIDDTAPDSMRVRALSLAVAQKCNLGCTYCYASQGDFGGAPKNMPLETALAAVDLLLAETSPAERINLAFLGGEPLVNRAVLRRTAEYAAERASRRGQTIGFSITTNGTMLTAEDWNFFDAFGFAVTVSLDGPREAHDRQRPFKGGRGSFDAIVSRLKPLLAQQGSMQVTARVTVTPSNLQLRETLDELLALGFYSVGFSPMLASPTGQGEMDVDSLDAMLGGMIACGQEFERRVLRNEPYAFANIMTALREIHRGTHRPYPCGAGAAYLGVSADGDLAACHRFVGNTMGGMGSLSMGVDRASQAAWLRTRHVHVQEPCRSCWARYLCGGGCHHEVLAGGRRACDFIRGWLHYCLQAYLRLSAARPDMFMGERPVRPQ
jgi:uncharacterized protein